LNQSRIWYSLLEPFLFDLLTIAIYH